MSSPRSRYFAYLAMKDATVWRKSNILFHCNGTTVLLYGCEDQAQQHYDNNKRDWLKMILDTNSNGRLYSTNPLCTMHAVASPNNFPLVFPSTSSVANAVHSYFH